MRKRQSNTIKDKNKLTGKRWIAFAGANNSIYRFMIDALKSKYNISGVKAVQLSIYTQHGFKPKSKSIMNRKNSGSTNFTIILNKDDDYSLEKYLTLYDFSFKDFVKYSIINTYETLAKDEKLMDEHHNEFINMCNKKTNEKD